MFFVDLLFVILFTAIFAAVLGGSYRRKGGGGFLFFLVVVLLGTWAIGSQTNPIGPLIWGVSWLSFLFIGFIISLLLASIAAMYPEPNTQEHADDIESEVATGTAFNIFFWILIVVLVLMIIIGYV